MRADAPSRNRLYGRQGGPLAPAAVRIVLGIAVLILAAVWGLQCVAFAVVGGVFHARRLPATRHPQRVRTPLI
jgi:hypothetical protein